MTARATKKRVRKYHHGDAREALLEAALRLVQRDGAATFSLREAARKVGVDPATSYRHFADRQGVLIAIAQRGFVRLAARFEEIAASTDGLERVLALGAAYVRFAFESPAEFRVMFGDSGLHSRDPRLYAPELKRSAFSILEEAAGQAAPKAASLGAAALAVRLWALAHGVARLAVDGAVPLEPDEAVALLDATCRDLWRGLATKARR